MAKKKAEDASKGVVTQYDEGWSDYILDKLRPDEKDLDGNPFTNGLKRLVEEELGPIIREEPRVVASPASSNEFRAVVEFTVEIAWKGDREDVRAFGDAADVYPGNTDPMFARFAVATATSRARGRCYKNALGLNRVYSSEELTTVPMSDSGIDGLIVTSQIKGIDKFCRELDVSVIDFINMGEGKYENIQHVPYAKAQGMIEHLNGLYASGKEAPKEIRGYKENWRKS